MVTYVLRERFGSNAVLPSEDIQLEAYCSGLGKVLLSAQSEASISAYLAEGTLVSLTENTIVDADALRHELERVHVQGWAQDDGEVLPGLCCLAVPIRDATGRTHAAISISRQSAGLQAGDLHRYLPNLREASLAIAAKLFDPVALTVQWNA